MTDSQDYPWNFNLINNVEYIVIILGFEVFCSKHFYMGSSNRYVLVILIEKSHWKTI